MLKAKKVHCACFVIESRDLLPAGGQKQPHNIWNFQPQWYGSETWALIRALQDKVDAFDNIAVSSASHIRIM